MGLSNLPHTGVRIEGGICLQAGHPSPQVPAMPCTSAIPGDSQDTELRKAPLQIINFFEKKKRDLLVGGRVTNWQTLYWESSGGREWDGWMASLTQWTWIWANSGRQWWTRSLVCCSPWGRKELDTTWQLNNNSNKYWESLFKSWLPQSIPCSLPHLVSMFVLYVCVSRANKIIYTVFLLLAYFSLDDITLESSLPDWDWHVYTIDTVYKIDN